VAPAVVPQRQLTGKSLVGKVALALQARAAARNGRSGKAATFLQDHTGTLTALGFADTAAWHTGLTWGLVATAVCIVFAEFKVRG
jgi:uncharacterized protein with von Willebrand factor type A (vWA) domain